MKIKLDTNRASSDLMRRYVEASEAVENASSTTAIQSHFDAFLQVQAELYEKCEVRVLTLAEAEERLQKALRETTIYGGASGGYHFSLAHVPHNYRSMTCPVAYAEWMRRQAESGEVAELTYVSPPIDYTEKCQRLQQSIGWALAELGKTENDVADRLLSAVRHLEHAES